MDNDICEELKGLMKGTLKANEPMSKHTSFGIGGPVDAWAAPETLEDFFALLDVCEKKNIPYRVVGHGTNLLVRDGGIDGVVISLRDACRNLAAEGERIIAGAGVSLGRAVRFAAEKGLQGLEFCVGIPGCVGGALVANAGAWGVSMGDILAGARIYTPGAGKTRKVPRNEISFDYRKSDIASFGVVLEAEFNVTRAEPETIRARMKEHLARRAETQPVGFKSAGCVFKNPTGCHAGALIDALGFKGYMSGDAMVSDVHANFIINAGSATAADVMRIISEIKGRVRGSAGIELEEEIEILGRD
ncbi:UDP-N-acetylmuramate dehydrogenase [Candidatus Poribacteria bacterium]|nr:UDP-N-acetylmuramate dehydrogenase [Candidatus Poribacteria bacterium]